jgi:hypothetical protein
VRSARAHEPSQQEYFERYLIVPQAKQLGAAIVADVANPAGHQSAVGNGVAYGYHRRREMTQTKPALRHICELRWAARARRLLQPQQPTFHDKRLRPPWPLS